MNINKAYLEKHPAARQLVDVLKGAEEETGLEQSQVYFRFPLYRDLDGHLVECRLLVVSPKRGLILFWTIDEARQDIAAAVTKADEELDQVYSALLSRCLRNRSLRKGRSHLLCEISTAIYAPFFKEKPCDLGVEAEVITSDGDVIEFIDQIDSEPLRQRDLEELLSTIDGAKGMIRPKDRSSDTLPPTSKGYLASRLEGNIALFDIRQKLAYTSILEGVQRVRGLAGSGKTVILAMKAALTHIRFPDATIVYTFHTKSLYQLVKRLITRFYRQFEDHDPDWDGNIKIMHGWGGASTPGIYSEACRFHEIPCLSFGEASRVTLGNPFDYACKSIKKEVSIRPMYDFILVDEGQDFPLSFLSLCRALAKNEAMVLAYDELQTIFQTQAPTAADIFGKDATGQAAKEFSDDVVLYKCYRNPREIIVCAHALGLGVYGDHIVQMLENKGHWEDVGYKVESGDFTPGSRTVIFRPKENSLPTLSDASTIDDLVGATKHDDLESEAKYIAKSIKSDLDEGLRPDDIMVITVDDRNARVYLDTVSTALRKQGVAGHNLHSDPYGVRDFAVEGMVTLTTVHKAKGNEAYMVYICGVDALFLQPDVRTRNMLFVAMTRAKGWVRISGVGNKTDKFLAELRAAKKEFPQIVFKYPSDARLLVMRRDLKKAVIEKQKIARMLDELMEHMTPKEVMAEMQLRERKSLKKKSTSRRKHRD